MGAAGFVVKRDERDGIEKRTKNAHGAGRVVIKT